MLPWGSKDRSMDASPLNTAAYIHRLCFVSYSRNSNIKNINSNIMFLSYFDLFIFKHYFYWNILFLWLRDYSIHWRSRNRAIERDWEYQ
jgi:hypothetical protein